MREREVERRSTRHGDGETERDGEECKKISTDTASNKEGNLTLPAGLERPRDSKSETDTHA